MALKPASTDPNRKDELKKYQQWLDDGMPSKSGPQGPPTFGVVTREPPADWEPTPLPGLKMGAVEYLHRRVPALKLERKDPTAAAIQAVREADAKVKAGELIEDRPEE
ncbi:hypothetical protein [Halomonas sp. CKK8]|uniref:hypothetical protein n=1 Tax=Halomonas sp. CKK8 TaxID=3036127 RepID=UPI00241526B4|nr:hypothetical protein [Halomonas sp. CKK8]WFM71818.1 hypothetical protein P8934_02175 [Halomonas sp. CKK8]